jgi:hypothetical protein
MRQELAIVPKSERWHFNRRIDEVPREQQEREIPLRRKDIHDGVLLIERLVPEAPKNTKHVARPHIMPVNKRIFVSKVRAVAVIQKNRPVPVAGAIRQPP